MSKLKNDMKKELSQSLSDLEREKNISQGSMIEAIKTAIFNAYRTNFKEENCEVEIDESTFETNVYSVKKVVGEVLNSVLEISLDDAKLIDENAELDSEVKVKIDPKSFGRISVTNAKNQISQKLREEEKQVVYNDFAMKKGGCISGKVSRIAGKNIYINLGDADGFLSEQEQVESEHFKVGDRIKVYVLDVTMTHKGARILVSRTHKELVRGLFADEVVEMNDGTVEIKSISREPGSRSKIAVWSNDEDVDAVGACVGMNGDRVDSVVDELFGEKIDIVNYDENPAYFIENALSPAKVIFVAADPDDKEAFVVVPDYQLSLAIGKEGQNARLAAKLTGYKIDIKSESQAREAGELPDEYDSSEYEEVEEAEGDEE